jgi:parallel beta-helix repeat protein
LLLALAACSRPADQEPATPAADETSAQETETGGATASGATATLPPATPTEAMATETAVPTAVPTATTAPIATAEAPLTLEINADGSGDLPSLPEAIAYAAPGSTIELSAGEFVLLQTLVIEKALAISGAGVDETTILTHAEVAGVQYGGGGLLSLSDLTIRHSGAAAADLLSAFSGEMELADCRLRGAPISAGGQYGAGLFILNEAQVRASGCEISDNGGAGILLIRQAQLTLQDSLVSANAAGILFDGSTGGEVSGNVIEENGDGGIYVFAGAHPQISSNQILNNIGYGIHYQLNGDAGGLVQDNELTNNNVVGPTATGTDIVIYNAFAPRLTGNVCKGGEGLAMVLGTAVAADTSGIIFFDTGAGTAQEIAPEDNQCAIAYCSPSSGTDEFRLECESIINGQ